MAIGRRRILGIMLSGRWVTAAEVRGGTADQPALESVARIEITDPLTWDEPAKIGAALAERMRAAGMKARHAVIGLPAAWVLTRSVTVPPAEGEALRKLVANKAERAFAAGAKELAIDYIPPHSARGGGKLSQAQVLLVAAQQQRVEATVAMAQAAGLTVDAVTATSAVVAMVSAEPADLQRSLTLMVGDDASELVIHSGRVLEAIRPLRKVPASAANVGVALGNQLRQAQVISRGRPDETPGVGLGGVSNGDQPETPVAGEGELWLWDALGLDHEARRHITAEAGAADLREGQLDQWVYANGAMAALAEEHAAARYAGAVALARAGLETELRPVDWLHTRLAEPKQQTLSERGRTVIIAAVAAAVLVVGGVLHYQSLAAEVAQLEAEAADLRTPAAEAREVVSRVQQAEAWFGERTSILACLEALTAAFGEDPAVWATEVSLRENLNGTVAGAAVDHRRVLEVRDAMQASSAFTNVTVMYLREADRSSGGEIGWAIAFTYLGPADSMAAAGQEGAP